MLKEVEIRDLQLEDIYEKEGLLDCLSQLAPCELSKKDIENLYFDRQYTGMRTIVVILKNCIVGTGTLIIEQKIIHNGGKVGRIEDVAVMPQYQRFGFGTLLIEELIAIAKVAGCYKLLLNCSEEIEPFYKNIGFHSWKHTHTLRMDLTSK
jgi:glucosamine-phosphate N-acetyltransferase